MPAIRSSGWLDFRFRIALGLDRAGLDPDRVVILGHVPPGPEHGPEAGDHDQQRPHPRLEPSGPLRRLGGGFGLGRDIDVCA